MSDIQSAGEFLLYQTEDAQTRIQVRLSEGGLWLTQQHLADLYQGTPQNITQHIRAIYSDGELQEAATCKPFLQVRQESGRQVSRSLKHYSLEMVLAIGYRVRSPRGVQFRRWATEMLKGYLVKGFVLDDERFKGSKDDAYFEELLARIRDIRSTEKVFWKKVLDIYATSVDYDASAESSQRFFATVQKSLKAGEDVSVVGFGTFTVRKRAARTGRNPRTNEAIKIKASKVPAFKAGKTLKDALN